MIPGPPPMPNLAKLPPRVELCPLPRLYVYEHCPFSARARLLLGLKNVKFVLVHLGNDDAETPTALIGKKGAPVFEPKGAGAGAIGESLDIVKLIDTDPRFGAPDLLRPASGRTDLPGLFDAVSDPLNRLLFVRFAWSTALPEMTFADGRNYFLSRHQLKDPESYVDNFNNSPQYIAKIAERMDELAAMIHSKECITEGGLSYDDVLYFPKLRSLTCIKGLELPQKVRDYLDYQSVQAEFPLLDHIAM